MCVLGLAEAAGGVPGRSGSGRWTELEEAEEPFRGRACTDGTLHSRRPRWRHTSPAPLLAPLLDRRMSISMRGTRITH